MRVSVINKDQSVQVFDNVESIDVDFGSVILNFKTEKPTWKVIGLAPGIRVITNKD